MVRVISIWLRAIRFKFLLASIMAVSNGIAIAYWKTGRVDISYAILTFFGIACLHASVDLLNDYWDFKKGIDSVTKRTKFSGGTGVLPENLLKPKSLYAAGIIFLLLGVSIGSYFILVRGIPIAIILGFATFAIYFYSISIINIGLGEVFVAIKGALIVIGTFYVQTGLITPGSVYIGIIVGILSFTVLFINSFPDYSADLSKGRRTLVILLGKKRAARMFSVLILITYILIIVGIILGYARITSIICLWSVIFALKAIRQLNRNYNNADKLEPGMSATIVYSRIVGFTIALSMFF